ncbi:MAG TPA: hypothetical protein VG937_31150 [Polyangiaceae bacterium]|jgi:hypothetical protein|nr:hypothetical protein [Polyangiaceae bacterium]
MRASAPRWVGRSILGGCLWACSPSGGEHSGAGGASSGTAAAGELYGSFTTDLVAAEPPEIAALLGVVFDHPSPAAIPLEVETELDGCQLLVAKHALCIPSCGAAGVCTAPDHCTPYPSPQNVGTVRVQGLGASEIIMNPDARYVYQPLEPLPFPPCSEGAAVTLHALGFEIEGRCIAPLARVGPEAIQVVSGSEVPLTWEPPGDPGVARVQLKLDVSHHGGKKGEIDCDVPDTGSFTIPEPLITRLVGLGLAGYPAMTVSRVSTATAQTERGVQLVMSSSVTRFVDTGVRSCRDETECGAGMACTNNACE